MVTEMLVNIQEGNLITIMQGTKTVESYQLGADEKAIVTIKVIKAVYSEKKGA